MNQIENYNPEDRGLEKELTKHLIDNYFDQTESWLRAILRMCIFSWAHVDGQGAFLIECPNQAVAKRLTRKTYPLLWFAENFVTYPTTRGRVLICYLDKGGDWQCYDSRQKSWMPLQHLNPFSARSDC